MIKVSIRDLKTHFSKYLARVEKGEVIVICKRNMPVAEIRPLERPPTGKRRVGFMKGEFEVPPEFHEPLDRM